MAVVETEDQLVWEARRRNGAAIAAAVAGVCTFAGTAWRGLTLSDLPRNGLMESLGRAAAPGPIGDTDSLKVDTFQYFHDHAAAVLASAVLVAIGYVALGWALTYLAVATRARRPEATKLLVYLPLAGGILQGLATVLSGIGTNTAISDFLDGARTVDDAADVSNNGLTVFASLIAIPGALALALGLILIGLNAMRVGLLTRFMGVLAIITGGLMVLPLGGPLPIVQCFWLVMLAFLFTGRWPGGPPPAWRTGNAEPWPTAAEVREQRQRAAAEARGEVYEPEPREPEPASVGAGPSPSASARKRKRKRR